jgi:hypothetical protein
VQLVVVVIVGGVGGIEIAQRTDHLHFSDRGVRLAPRICEHVARLSYCADINKDNDNLNLHKWPCMRDSTRTTAGPGPGGVMFETAGGLLV